MNSTCKNKKIKKNWLNAGFTLLELIVVITIMGFLAAMVIPVIGYAEKNKRVKLTEERLELVRTAIVGPSNAFDAQGRRILGGYVGDMGDLPVLYKSMWDDTNKRWVWDLTTGMEIKIATGHPRGLWLATGWLATGMSWDNWRGPYITVPADPFPDDAERFDVPVASGASLDLFHMLQTTGKLSDAWGQTLLFWKDNEDALWIISQGPDRESKWSATSPYYNETEPENEDNIVLKIPAVEWYNPNQPVQERITRHTLDDIRNALIGPPTAFDPGGRRIVGGYIGDMGAWPELYKWDGSQWELATGSILTTTGVVMQPRALWTNDPDGDGSVNNGTNGGGTADLTGITIATGSIGWRGPYLSKPWGAGENEVLRDAWERPLYFWYDHSNIATGAQMLTIASAGLDGNFGTGDDEKLEITKDRWIASGMEVVVRVNNVYTEPLPGHVRLWITSGAQIDKITTGTSIAAGVNFFTLPQHDIPAGLRRIEVVSGTIATGTVYDFTTIYIGAGNTQSPSEHNLILEISSP